MNGDGIRLAKLTLPAKLLVTLFVLIVGPGYLCGTANIYFHHQLADDEPGLTIDDLRATFHGMEKTYKPDDKIIVNSKMLKEVRPEGQMREHLEEGGEPAIRGLIKWLEDKAKEDEFDKPGLVEEGDPSAKAIIKANCIECHNADDGESADIPYAETSDGEPQYSLVMVTAKAEVKEEVSGMRTKVIKPISIPRLVQVTHVHVLSMPVFAFIVGVLFMMTGVPGTLKMVIGPVPLLAVMLDISGWWIARWVEPFIFVIGAAGALFAAFYAIQILCILGSLWLGRRT